MLLVEDVFLLSRLGFFRCVWSLGSFKYASVVGTDVGV